MRIRRILVSFFVFILVCALTVPAFANDIDDAKNARKGLEEKKKQTEQTLKKLEKEKSNLIKYIESLDEELGRLSVEIDELNASIKKIKKYIKITREELKEAKQKEKNQYDTMKKRIKFMYENGNSAYIEVLLSSESLSDLLNKSEYILKISEYDKNMLQRYEEAKELVIEKEAEADRTYNEYLALAEELDYEQSVVESLIEDKNKELQKHQESIYVSQELVAEYEEDIAAQDKLIEDMIEQERIRQEEEERRRREEEERKKLEAEEERKRLEAEAEEKKRQAELAKAAEEKARLEEEAKKLEEQKNDIEEQQSNTEEPTDNSNVNNSSDNTSDPNNFIWPCPDSGRITSYFGDREQPIAGASTNHKAIDIGAPTGTRIIAAGSGTVVISTYSSAAGNYIMLSHGNGTFTVYMHCSKLLVNVGDTVKQGDLIAYVGSTGVSTGPHLHFGVMVDNVYVNPLNYVKY